MISVDRMLPVDPDAVFAILDDGWTYAGWVVGTSHIRDVDADWPAVGARIHHSVGAWPLHLKDVTRVVNVEPGRLLELDAGLWPFGTARVRFSTVPQPGGGTYLLMQEEAVAGPASLLPEGVQGPLLRARNRETLARLTAQVTSRTSG